MADTVKRRLFTILSALSLLLLVAVVVMWVRSYRRTDHFFETCSTANVHSVHSKNGRIEYYSLARWVSDDFTAGHRFVERDRQFLGFRHYRWRNDVGKGSWYVTVPHWALVVMTGVAPASWLYRRRRLARISRATACPSCGYDLRATPERCPECGSSVGGVAP